jgi:hypothetical protein
VLDPFNREVVGWPLKPRKTADIVTDGLPMAWFTQQPASGLLHHLRPGQPVHQPCLSGQAQFLENCIRQEHHEKLVV